MIDQDKGEPDRFSGGPTRKQKTVMDDLDKNNLITDPVQEDCNKLVDRLSRGYYARTAATHEPLPCTSPFHSKGVVSAIFSEESEAASLAEIAASSYGMIDTEVVRVTGLWDLFQECASCGYEGVVLDDYYPVTFFNRLTDMDRRAPTLMWMRFPDSTNDLYGFFFGLFKNIFNCTFGASSMHCHYLFQN